MLGKWPFPNKLSEMSAWAIGLWIRRVLVRAQEGQLKGPIPLQWVGPFVFCARRYRFCYGFSTVPAVRQLTVSVGDGITFNIVASSACWWHVSKVVTSFRPPSRLSTTAAALAEAKGVDPR